MTQCPSLLFHCAHHTVPHSLSYGAAAQLPGVYFPWSRGGSSGSWAPHACLCSEVLETQILDPASHQPDERIDAAECTQP